MQVSQMSDAVTHAVLGKKESVEMGVSDSAALMHIFSTALYTHPMLAAVREIICNGWDGHISSGKTDVPLQITVDGEFVRIRDFGTGIPHDKIGSIYGVFGNSTKRDDGSVTGGFGLGSKAPFAYTDNFEVVNHNGGIKAIYRVSKSSMEAGGKPTIDTIVKLPTEETGIMVSMNIKNIYDQEKFLKLIREVLVLGEIKATINGGAVVETLPTSETKTGYIINSATGTLLSRINLRYGNVVYPIPHNEYYGEMFEQVLRVMNQLWERANVIFLAPPDTVTIAPSREALIFTEGTLKTIKELMSKFNPNAAKASPLTCRQLTNMQVNQIIKKSKASAHAADLSREITLPVIRGTSTEHTGTGPFAFDARKATVNHAISRRSLRVNDDTLTMKRLRHAIFQGAVDKTRGKRFLKAALQYNAFRRGRMSDYSRVGLTADGILQTVLMKEITYPVLSMIASHEYMDKDCFWYADQRYGGWDPKLTNPKKIVLGGMANLMGFLKPRVLLARSKKAISEFMSNERVKPGNDHNTWGWMIYQLPKSDKAYADIAANFEALGYEVHTYLPIAVREVREVDMNGKEAAPRKASPKRKGYLTLASSFDGSGYLLTHARTHCKPEDHVVDPIAFVTLKTAAQSNSSFGDFTDKSCHALRKLWGHKIAVVTSTQIEKLVAKGVPPLSKFIYQHVDDTLSASADFRRYLAFGQFFKTTNNRPEGTDGIIRGLMQHHDLADSLPIKFRFKMSVESEMLVTFFEDDSYYGTKKNLPKCLALADKVKKHDMVKQIKDQIRMSTWAHYVDLDRVAQALHTKAPNDPKLDVPYTIIRNLMTKQEAQQ